MVGGAGAGAGALRAKCLEQQRRCGGKARFGTGRAAFLVELCFAALGCKGERLLGRLGALGALG